jgi:cytochrome b pre-mRNA-processing protein 3
MLGFLFRTLTAQPARGAAIFAAASRAGRQRHWYVEGAVADTIDGRFAMLATTVALVLVRLEHEGDAGNLPAVALTERFVEVMESEHRQLGLGDPTLGKKVRKLLGALSARTDEWRDAVAQRRDWDEVVRESIYKGNAAPDAIRHSAEALRQYWSRLARCDLSRIEEGRFE